MGVNLSWTNLNDVQETLSYRRGSTYSPLTVVSGLATLSVLADLDRHTYEVSVDGVVVGADIPFDNPVNLDTVRLYTSVPSERSPLLEFVSDGTL